MLFIFRREDFPARIVEPHQSSYCADDHENPDENDVESETHLSSENLDFELLPENSNKRKSYDRDEVDTPSAKRVKQDLNSKDIVLLEDEFALKVLKTANQVWASTDSVQRLERSHVIVAYNRQTKTYSAKVSCLLCTSIISVSTTIYSVSLANYKRHVTILHLLKNGKDEQNQHKKSLQPKLQDFLSKKASKDQKNAEMDGSTVDLTGFDGSEYIIIEFLLQFFLVLLFNSNF